MTELAAEHEQANIGTLRSSNIPIDQVGQKPTNLQKFELSKLTANFLKSITLLSNTASTVIRAIDRASDDRMLLPSPGILNFLQGYSDISSGTACRRLRPVLGATPQNPVSWHQRHRGATPLYRSLVRLQPILPNIPV